MTKTGDVKREKAKLVRMIGLRMKHARELVNMTQEVAAERLGYANSSKLSKIENASDTDNVPNYIIERAATLYDVSVDYLYGRTDDWDPETPRDSFAMQYVADMLEKLAKRDLVLMAQYENKVRKVIDSVLALSELTREAEEALNRFCVMHPEIEDMRASRLISSIKRASAAGETAKGELQRYQRVCKRGHSLSDAQLGLDLNAPDDLAKEHA